MSNPIVHTALLLAVAATAWGQAKDSAQAEKDPHRPVCTSASCRKIKSFLKTHYCGESPYGNGPEDGCLISRPKKLGSGIKITADFVCKWRTTEENCQQHGQPSPEVRSILSREMRKLGLPAQEDKSTHFTVWESTSLGWSVAKADYGILAGTDLALCQVIVVIDRSSHVSVLRELPFQKTDADVPTVTTWSLIDLADVDGCGHIEAVLEGDSYEDHWLEVDKVQSGSAKTIFSGLGYYL